ncbi:MAG: recombination-associated protein RdgC [Verrucomicrobiia bacterium]
MSFESGQIGFRMCYALKELPTDAVQRFASKASPPLKSLGAEPAIGWVGGRHLFDLPISDENARLGGYLRLSLLKAERKVPSSLLRAESFMEELARMKADNKPFLDRKAKSEVRKQVMSRLLPQMPPTLRAIPFVHDERGGVVYVGAVSEQQMDALRVNFLAATGIDLVPVNVETAVAQRRGQKAKQWAPASFSPEAADDEMENRPGQDFLTWLWFASEDRGGLFESRERGQIAVALEGPLLLERPGDGAHVIAIREGVPTASPEAQTALMTGKKLRRAKLTLACQDETWMTSFDADSFSFRVKLPDPKEVLDPASRFQERIQKLGEFRDLFFELLDQFLDDRCDEKNWAKAQKKIHHWAATRDTKK